MPTKNFWSGSVLSGIILLVAVFVMVIIRASYDSSTATTMFMMFIITVSGTANLTRGLMLRNSVKK